MVIEINVLDHPNNWSACGIFHAFVFMLDVISLSCLHGPYLTLGQRSRDTDLSGPREQDGTKQVEEGEGSGAQAPPTRSESTQLKTLMRDELLINVQKFTTQVNVTYIYNGSLCLMCPCMYVHVYVQYMYIQVHIPMYMYIHTMYMHMYIDLLMSCTLSSSFAGAVHPPAGGRRGETADT